MTNAKLSDIINKLICGDAGIGRQASLRCLCQYWRVGSSPISRTSVKDIRFSSVLYFISRQISKALSSKKATLESHEIFDFVEAELVPQSDRQAPGAPVSIGVWVQVPFPAPYFLYEKDIMPANGLTKPLAGIYLCKNQKYASVDIF